MFQLADGDVSVAEIVQRLEPALAHHVLKDIVLFSTTERAPVVADLFTERNLIPDRRLAAQLARVDMTRCLELIRRLARTIDGRTAHIESVTSAYLSARDTGPVPDELAAIWSELPALYPDDDGVVAAQLEVLAAEDPKNVLAALDRAFDQIGASMFLGVAARVVHSAMPHDRDGALALAAVGSPLQRALVAEGIGQAEASAPELPELFDEIVDEWSDDTRRVDRSHGGTVRLLFPLLRTAIAMRDFARLQSAVNLLQPSQSMLAAATWKPMRAINLTDQRWRTQIWDELVAATQAGEEAFVADLPPEVGAAAWKLESLPMDDLPWFDANHLASDLGPAKP
ncbi:MAG: hypothetical protein QM831_04275 [Kofleriaceae bacterium]